MIKLKCGNLCSEFSCDLLKRFACDEKQDEGKRNANAERRAGDFNGIKSGVCRVCL